jgi:hypothetical protein
MSLMRCRKIVAREEASIVCGLLDAAGGTDGVRAVEEEAEEGGRLEAGGFFITWRKGDTGRGLAGSQRHDLVEEVFDVVLVVVVVEDGLWLCGCA